MKNRKEHSLSTQYISNEIAKCEDLDELKERILPQIQSMEKQWEKKINEIIEESSYTLKDFSSLCGKSRQAVSQWKKGILPKNRDIFIKIGLIAGYDLERMNRFLNRFGKYPSLYSKSLEDAVCIYVIQNEYGEEAIHRYLDILDKIKNSIIDGDAEERKDIDTKEFDQKLSDVRDEDELEQFINENIAVFSLAYRQFNTRIKEDYIDLRYPLNSTSVFNMAEGQGWSSSLKQCVSAIRQKKWYPTRQKILSLGFHLGLTREELDGLFEMAHMEPLYAKNPFESVIIFILEDAELNNMMDMEDEEYDQDYLCRYAKGILEQMNFPEIESFLSELSGLDEEE